MIGTIFLIFFLGFFSLKFGIRYVIRQNRRKVWIAFANQHGGTFVASQSWLSSKGDHVNLRLHGFVATLDYYTVSHGKTSTAYQRVTVKNITPADFTARIYQETPIFSALGKAFGGQDIVVRHDAFDQAFIVKSNAPARLLNHLDHDAMHQHLYMQDMCVELKGTLLTVVCVNLRYHHDEILAQMNLAALYARGFFGPSKQLGAPQAHRQLESSHHEASPNASW